MIGFVGDEHGKIRDRLFEEYQAIRNQGGVRMVLLDGTTGTGKTRIIQEFYRAIATDSDDGYWHPDALLRGVDSEFLKRRKRIFPEAFVAPAGAAPSFFWWGISCQRRPSGDPVQALADDQTQLKAHCGPIIESNLARKRIRFEALQLLVVSVGSILPIVGWLDSARSASSSVNKLITEVRKTRDFDEARIVEPTDNDRGDLVEALVSMVRDLARPDLPFIIVIDDAHDADASCVNFVRRVMSELGTADDGEQAAILIVATGWRDELASRQGSSEFGGVLRELEANPDIRSRLARMQVGTLDPSALNEAIEQVAPDTQPEVVAELAERSGGNALLLEGLLESARSKSTIKSGPLELKPSDIASLPAKIGDVYIDRWERLNPEIKRALALSSVQGMDFLCQLSKLTADRWGHKVGDPAFDRAVSPHGWVQQLSDGELNKALRFSQREFFEIASRAPENPLSESEVRDASVAMVGWIREAVESSGWESRPLEFQIAACSIGVRLALTLPDGMTSQEDDAVRFAQELCIRLARLEYQRGVHSASIKALLDKVQLHGKLEDSEGAHLARIQAGWWCRQLGSYEAGIELYETVRRRAANERLVIAATNDLSCIYCDLGRWEKALELAQEVLDRVDNGEGNIGSHITADLNVAIYQRCLGHEKGPDLTSEARERMERLVSELRALGALGDNFVLELELSRAEDEAGPESRRAIDAMYALAEYYFRERRFAQADYHYRRAANLLEKLGDASSLAMEVRLRLRLSELEFQRARTSRCKDELKRADEMVNRLKQISPTEATEVVFERRRLGDIIGVGA